MIAVDTSVVVAGFASWHAHHETAREIIRRKPLLAAQVAIETYSVLTRLPGAQRAASEQVWSYIVENFPRPWLSMSGDETSALLERLAAAGIIGGATYDALIGETVRRTGATLVSRDRRAEGTYRRLGVDVQFVD